MILIQAIILFWYLTSFNSNNANNLNLDQLPKWYFLHFHKAAGTNLCGIIRNSANSIRISSDQISHNCNSLANISREQRINDNSINNQKKTDMCSNLYQEYETFHINLISRETWFDSDKDDHLCSNINYITIIRNPIQRIISHLQFELLDTMTILKWLNQGKNRDNFYIQTDKHIGIFMFDNFYIRMLLFDEIFYAPLGSITKEHYLRAKKIF